MNYPNVAAVIADNTDLLQHKFSPNRDLDYAAYASELLPDIFGGRWIKSSGRLDFRPFASRNVDLRGMFDHAVCFRPRGSRGALSWNNCVAIGQPYNDLSDRFNHSAALLKAHGIGAWASRELSTWLPGRTVLIIAARALLDMDPVNFGFTALPAARVER